MKCYRVGGAVRDALLGLPVKDVDWVVVGATPEQMAARGFRPVGKDFPVFLHPETHEEYALARTERKTARGYHGFSFHCDPSVTLAQDLGRRDLTINAIAQDEDGRIVDPYDGRKDIAARQLRHVSEAFVEDPVRILRIARFAARFTDFTIAPPTLALMREMVASGEVDALVPERVWQELARGLMSARPSRMLLALRACGALARILPEVDALWGVPQPIAHHPEVDTGVHLLLALDAAADANASLESRFAVLVHDLGKASTPPDEWPRHIGHEARSVPLALALAERLRVPAACRDIGVAVAREHANVHRALELRASTLVSLLERLDLIRRPERLDAILAACEADAHGRAGRENTPYPQSQRLRDALDAAREIDAGAIARSQAERAAHDDARQRNERIARAIREARVASVRARIDAGRSEQPGDGGNDQ
ncbi:MAG: multifunctional CCA addition/repair protein [Burkholderiaceae bacterium]